MQMTHIMALQVTDIERMIMQARYMMQLEASSVPVELTDMEREGYRKQIDELIRGMQALLDANNAMGERLKRITEDYESLKAEHEKLKGQLEYRKRAQYGKVSEKKPTDNPPSDKGVTKDDEEEEYIENGSRNDIPPAEDPEENADPSPSETPEKKERDLSNRPGHYNTMHADICVEHDCDLDRLKELGLEFIRYTRPVDQFDRISLVRQDRYRYVWVRDKDGNEFSFFIPKSQEKEKRKCVFVNESKYDKPNLIPHTSSTYSMLSDLAVNRYQYALSCGREMYRMFNEKMHMSAQTILNWLVVGSTLLDGALKRIKKLLLKPGSAIYCDETWVDTRVYVNGKLTYVKRYMWVIVNMTTKVCYYLFGSRRRSVIEDFLGDFKGTLMTDAYTAYAFFSKLDECTHACCWAHVRRIFVSAFKDYKDILAKEYIELIGMLYKVELDSIVLHRTEAEVLTAREEVSKPILDLLIQKAAELQSLCKIEAERKRLNISSKLEHALNYMINHWEELNAYIKIGNVLIDNNCCERAVRPFTNLRKSFGGFSSEKGGVAAAAYMSVIETCKLQKKVVLDSLNGYFKGITEGRTDYEVLALETIC